MEQTIETIIASALLIILFGGFAFWFIRKVLIVLAIVTPATRAHKAAYKAATRSFSHPVYAKSVDPLDEPTFEEDAF